MRWKSLFLSSALLSSLAVLTVACRESNDASNETVMDGSWTTACLPADSNTAATHVLSSRIVYTFGGDHEVTRETLGFSDAGCQTRVSTLSHVGEFALQVRNEVSLYTIDFTFDEVVAEPLTAELAEAWSAESFCGIASWTADGPQSVLGKAGEGCPSFGTTRIFYEDIVQVAPGIGLRFGNILNNTL
ncbi:MAG: hypothetical protein EOP10_34395, partial [Proteobacteria bacterium]